jgi:hypothetical protein
METPTSTTEPVAAAEPKQTIPQKVEALQARKTMATTEMNAAPEGTAKTALQDEIAVIDRKLRWYAGRSGEAKATAGKTPRPTKARASKNTTPAVSADTPAPVTVPTAANES